MGDLHAQLLASSRIARPVEFDSGGTYIWRPHELVTPAILEGQHAIRSWEYSQALRAIEKWAARNTLRGAQPTITDVGGAGSNFYKALRQAYPDGVVEVVDPAFATPVGQYGVVYGVLEGATAISYPLNQWVMYGANVERSDIVCCLSVLEHVPPDQVSQFLTDLRTLVIPGGLLFLTCDLAPAMPDTYHFRWMRAGWCPTPAFLVRLTTSMETAGFDALDADPAGWEYRGATVYDYSVCSFAVVKRLGS